MSIKEKDGKLLILKDNFELEKYFKGGWFKGVKEYLNIRSKKI